jgi:hypothetical protein
VTGTEGEGLFIRQTAGGDEVMGKWPDGTKVTYQGNDQEINGQLWKKVKDPAGAIGWMLDTYLR